MMHLGLGLALVLLGADTPADELVGDWVPGDRDVVVHIGKVGGGYEGTVVGDAGQKALLTGLTWDAAGKVWRGQVWAPKRQAFFPAVLRLQSPDAFVLTAGTGVFAREVVWHRR